MPGGTHGETSETLALSRKNRIASQASNYSDARTGTEHWRSLMRKFSHSHKETCRTVPFELKKIPRNKKNFPTGSSYAGTWDMLGMSGKGTYTFPHTGVVYEGEFDDGLFHGDGEMRYQCGAVIKGKWRRGKLMERKLIFADGLEYNEHNWEYCRYPDRRYTIEHDNGLEPAGRSYQTADQPPHAIPDECFDTGDGIYDPHTKAVYHYEDDTHILRAPEPREQTWITQNCRGEPDLPKGACPYLYEKWQEPAVGGVPVPKSTNLVTSTYSVQPKEESPIEELSPRVKSHDPRSIHLYSSRRNLTSTTDFYSNSTGMQTSQSSDVLDKAIRKSITNLRREAKAVLDDSGYDIQDDLRSSIHELVGPRVAQFKSDYIELEATPTNGGDVSKE